MLTLMLVKRQMDFMNTSDMVEFEPGKTDTK